MVTAGLQGQLEPFSDPRRTSGGVARLATVLDQARGESGAVLWADAGDALFGSTDLPPELLPQAERKARAVAEAYTLLGNDALAVGELDLLRGPAFLRRAGLRGLLDAGRGPEGLPQATLTDAGGVKFAFLAAGARSLSTLGEQAAEARGAGAEVVIALVHETLEQTAASLERLPPGTIDAAIAGHAASERSSGAPVQARDTPVFQIPQRGRAVLRLDFTLLPGAPAGVAAVPSGEERHQTIARAEAQLRELEAGLDGPVQEARVAAMRQRLEEARREPPTPERRNLVAWGLAWLSPDVPAAPRVAGLLAAYRGDLSALNVEAGADGRACQQPRVGQPVLEGVTACRACHAAAVASWEGTPHARAFQPLVAGGRAADLECARCHLTGLFAPGGVCAIGRPDGREGVQCEACHGPGSAHVQTPGRRLLDVTEQTCRGCHTPDHDPSFSYPHALPRVLGLGHGSR